jgi:hypothetical protein
VWRKRLQHEEEVKKEPLNYNDMFNYARLEKNISEKKKV